MPNHIGRFEGRISVADYRAGQGGLVAGLLMEAEPGAYVLRDGSGSMPVSIDLLENHGLVSQLPCWTALRFESDGSARVVFRQPVHVNAGFRDLNGRLDLLRKRGAVHQAIRGFFLQAGFLETDTPALVPCPGMEPYLDTYQVDGLYLRTSPELHMKRLLAAGFDKIFQLAPCFRAGDHGSLHREEFLMLEWYRAFADLVVIQRDVAGLLAAMIPHAADPAYFQRPPRVVTCEALFEQYLGLKLVDNHELGPLRDSADRFGIHYTADDDWDVLYFRLFLDRIEPLLGQDAPTLVTQYPASQAALAKLGDTAAGGMPFCYRMELYLKGVEIANAFYELCDPNEQRRRFEKELQIRRDLGKPLYTIDEHFLGCLEAGLPPSAGIALGVDRLAMCVLGEKNLDAILPFAADRDDSEE